MSQLDAKSFYTILGLEKTADERAIKKAYFALVRQYPPETHPEEFQKLRKAYEVLSDAETRREYDALGALDAHGDEIGAEMREAMAALDQGRWADAQTILSALVAQHDELHLAKDMLGMAYLNDKKPERALPLFQQLARDNPQNAAYTLHKAYAFHALKDYTQAEAGYRAARRLDPEDVRAIVALGDCLMAQRRLDEAMVVVDEAIHHDGTVDFRDFALFMRKLDIEIERKRSAAMQSIIIDLLRIVPEEPAARKWVADRIASHAAPLFAEGRSDDANVLMEACAKLDPQRATGRMPPTFELDIARLPEASRAWLIAQNKAKTFGKVQRNALVVPIILLTALLALTIGILASAYGSRRGLPLGAVITLALLAGGAAAGLAYAIRRVIAASKSPYGAYTQLHPLYLLEVNVDRVRAWSLANLRDAHVTHHHQNGAYTGSWVELIFAKRKFRIRIQGRDAASSWATRALDLRRRVLELMYTGLVEGASDEMQLIPAALIPGPETPPTLDPGRRAERRVTGRWMAIAAGVALAIGLVAIPRNLNAGDGYAWDSATRYGNSNISELRRYLAKYPNGDHADEARQRIAALYEQGREFARMHPDAELHDALVAIVEALEASGTTEIVVSYAGSTTLGDLDLADLRSKSGLESLIDPRPSFAPSANERREATITRTLSDAFQKALGTSFSVTAGSSRSGANAPSPVALKVRYEIGLTGAIYERAPEPGSRRVGDDTRHLGIGIRWTCEIYFGDETTPRFTTSLESEPAKSLQWTTSGRYGERADNSAPYNKMAESAFADFKGGLVKRFGLEAQARSRD